MGVVGVVFGIAFIINNAMDMDFVGYPKFPNQETGRTFAYSVKNFVVYIFDWQMNLVYWLRVAEIVTGVLIAVLLISTFIWPMKIWPKKK
jgi:hypothetical protein